MVAKPCQNRHCLRCLRRDGIWRERICPASLFANMKSVQLRTDGSTPALRSSWFGSLVCPVDILDVINEASLLPSHGHGRVDELASPMVCRTTRPCSPGAVMLCVLLHDTQKRSASKCPTRNEVCGGQRGMEHRPPRFNGHVRGSTCLDTKWQRKLQVVEACPTGGLTMQALHLVIHFCNWFTISC